MDLEGFIRSMNITLRVRVPRSARVAPPHPLRTARPRGWHPASACTPHDTFLESLVNHDDAYRLLQNDRILTRAERNDIEIILRGCRSALDVVRTENQQLKDRIAYIKKLVNKS